jgi:hypothetical protein
MRPYLLAHGDVRAGRMHEWWLAPLVFTIVFAASTPTFFQSQSAYVPTIDTSVNQIAEPTPLSSAAPTAKPAPAPNAVNNAPAVLGASTSTPSFAFGLAAGGGLGSLSDDALNSELSDIKSIGVSWVRFDLDWSNIGAQGPGQYDWSDYDRVVSAINAHGLHSLAILDFTPGWAQSSVCSGSKMCEPANASEYGTFAAAAAAHYAPSGVRDWEIWNEPNNSAFFQPAADPVAYTSLLRAAYTAIKGVEPNATVLTGGLAPADDSGGNMSPPDFVNGMYNAGADGYFDALADHPYTWPYSPAYYLPGNAWDQMITIRNIMVAHGDGGKKIWITEYGAPTGGPGATASSGMTTAEGGDDHVTDALQAQMVTDAVHGATSYPWIGGFFWYSYIDQGTDSSTVENFFGLLNPDGSRKPAYYAFKQAIATH